MAARVPVRVLLDGHGGDETVSLGRGFLKELAAEGRWFRLFAEIVGATRGGTENPLAVFRAYWGRFGGVPGWIRGTSLRGAGSRLGAAVFRRSGTNTAAANPPGWCAFIHPEFVREMQLIERRRRWRERHPTSALTERERHYRTLTQENQARAFEVLDKSAAPWGVELSFPFWDKRLVEFCLALPADQKLRWGWTRSILRRAMEGVIPRSIQWRRDKTDFFENFRRSLVLFDKARIESAVRDRSHSVEEYLDLGALRGACDRFCDDTKRLQHHEVYGLWKAVSLIEWFTAFAGLELPSSAPLVSVANGAAVTGFREASHERR
jgi:asparagine synthase (glutamine-hydrolysing)